MIQNENLIKLIKKDTKDNLNFYKNLVHDSYLNSKDLVEKATEVREKINFGQKTNKNPHQEIPNIAKQIKQEIKNQKALQSMEKNSFRKDSKYMPKIQIFNQRLTNKIENNLKRTPKNQGILSFYNSENLAFHPASTSVSTEGMNSVEEATKKPPEQRNKIIRNNIDYDNKIKSLFFTNRYVEYSYQDKGDNLYENGDLFRYLFEKKMKKDKNPGLDIVKHDSIYLDIFKKLLKQIKDEKIEEINKPSIDSTNREEENLASDELKKINRYKSYKNEAAHSKSSSSGGGEGENIKETKKADFKSNFLAKISLCENNVISAENNDSLEWNIEKERENPSLGKSTADVSFNIDIETQITKKVKGKHKKEATRKMKINGPLVTIIKMPQENLDIQSIEEKGKFDVRNIKFDEDELEESINDNNNNKLLNGDIPNRFVIKKFSEIQNNEMNLINNNDSQQKDKFTIKKITKNGKELNKKILFLSNKIKEFQNKTYLYFFTQLQKYYKDFLINIENSSYSALKFLSNPNCISLELNPNESKRLLDHIYWHPKLQVLSLPTSFVASLKRVMDSKNLDCFLNTLSITQDAGVSSPPFEESIFKLFSGINSVPIQNIHFIDVPYNKKIADALFNHIQLFYSLTNSMLNDFFNNEKSVNNNIIPMSTEKENTSTEEIDNPKTPYFLNFQKTKLPIINLSWKKNPNSKMKSSKSEDSIDLRALYYILMEMLIKGYRFNNHKLPEVFNKLDLSESVVTDDIGFLVKIITQFKIIKELDISNTKLFSDGRVINSDNFLKKIKLTNKFTKIITVEDESTFMDNVMKDIEFFRNCTEQQKSQLSDFLKDEEMSYDYFMGIMPILEKMYVYNTDIKENVARDIYMLFKKLKFFNGFYCSSSSINNNILLNTIIKLSEIIQNDSSNYCENIFLLSN